MMKKYFFLFALFILVCQKQYAQYTLNNNAAQVACNEYRLTSAVNNQAGSVWNNVKINLTQSFDFNFKVFLGNNNSPGADGMAFVLQPISTSVGSGGGGLGFQNVSPSVGITLDTYQNGVDNDPAFDHIAIQLNGSISHNSANNIAGPVSAIDGNSNIEDGAWHNFRVTWDAATKTYTAYVDGVLRVTVIRDFVLDVFSGDPLVYWGFTASTGGENNVQSFRTELTPSYSISAAQKRCINELIAFTNNSTSFTQVVSVEWNFGDGTSPIIANNPTHTYTTAGDFTVTQKVTALDGCMVTNTQTIRIGTKPFAGFFTSNTCNTNFVSFTDTSTNAVGVINNWFWDFDNAGITSTAQSPSTTYTLGGPKTIKFIVKTVEGCESDTLTKIIQVNEVPAAPIVPAATITYCQIAIATILTATGTNLQWYTQATGGEGIATAPTPSTINTGTTTYYVSQTVGTCESPRTAITVMVDALPPAPAVTASVDYCQGATSVLLSATGTNLLWYTTATGGVGSVTAPMPSTITAGNTNYYVSQTVNGCESPRAIIVVTIKNIPAAPGVISPVVYCQGTSASPLTATGTNLVWYVGAGIGSTTAPTPATNALGNTTYLVTQTVNGCISPTSLIDVNIVAALLAPSVITPLNYCINATALPLTALGTNLLWYAQATGGTGVSVAPTPVTTSVGNTLYYVSQTSGNCESPRALLTVVVEPLSAMPTVSTPINYCLNATTIALTATGTNLLWYISATGGVGSTIAPIPSSATAGTFTFYVTQRVGNCESNRAAIVINVFATAAPIVVTKTYCPNDVALPATATGTNLLWYAAATGGVGSPTAPTPSTTIFPTMYNYYVSQTVNGCESPKALLTTIVDNALAIAIGNDTTICEGEVLTFNPTSTPLATSYEWRAIGVPLSTIQNVAIKNAVVNPVDTATYILKATLGGCTKEDTVIVNVRWKPVLDAGMNTAFCLNDSALLVGTITHNSFPITNYAWTPTDSLRTATQLQTWASPTKTTLYKLTINTTLANYGCVFTVSDSVKVSVGAAVQAYAGNDTIAVKGVPHQLYGLGSTNYTWTSPTALIQNPFVKNAKAILNSDAVFYLKVSDGLGCAGYDTVFVKVYEGPKYYIPNAFTPNGDGINDIFRAIPVGIANTTSFRIFNRFGELVFETNKWLKGWEGTYKGKKQPSGTYVWIVTGTDRNFNKVTEQGTVNLIR
jgi:gliding motility-associated-like protein